MLRGYRLAILTLAGLALGAAEPPKQATPSQGAKAKQQRAEKPAAPPETKPYAPYPSVADPRCYQSADHDSADLCAQWRAAIAAERGVDVGTVGNYIGIAGALLSFLSVILVLIAIRQTGRSIRIQSRDYGAARLEAKAAGEDTKRALAIAQQNADAAADQVKVAQETARRQLRAYISFMGGALKALPEAGQEATARLDIKNSGQTPASNIHAGAGMYVIQADMRLNIGPPLPDLARFELGPGTGHEFHVATAPLTEQQMEGLEKGELLLISTLYVGYDDIFGMRHTLRVAMRQHNGVTFTSHPHEEWDGVGEVEILH